MASSSRRYYSPAVGYFDPTDIFWFPPDPDPPDPIGNWVKQFCPAADDHDSPLLSVIKQHAYDELMRDKRRRMLRRMPYIVARQLALKKNKKKNATPQRRLLALEDAPDDLSRVVVSFL